MCLYKSRSFKWILIKAFLFIALLLPGCTNESPDVLGKTEITTPVSIQWTAVYLTPNKESDEFVTFEDFENDILVSNTIDQAIDAFSTFTSLQVLYIHPDAIEEIDDEWLREFYGRGITIAAIDISANELGQRLNIHTDMSAVKPEFLTTDQIIISAFQRVTYTESGFQENRITTNYFEDFEQAFSVFNLVSELTRNSLVSVPEAVFFSTLEQYPLIEPRDIVENNIIVVYTMDELAGVVENIETVQTIYFHPDVIIHVDEAWLLDIYKSGKIIAALNTPVSTITQKLGIYTQVDDFEMERAQGRMGVSVVQSPQTNASSYQILSEFFPDFKTIVAVVHHDFIANKNLLDPIPPLPQD